MADLKKALEEALEEIKRGEVTEYAMSDSTEADAVEHGGDTESEPQKLDFELVEKDIEVFSAGTWNGHTFTPEDIARIVENTNAVRHLIKPPLKLGHGEKQAIVQNSGLPAVGWVDSLRVAGDKIVATVSGIPDKVANLLKNAYRRVSSELLMNWRNPETGQRMDVLTGVALLGADLPAVTNLADIAALWGEDFEQEMSDLVAGYQNECQAHEGVLAFTVDLEEETLSETEKVETPVDAPEEVTEEVAEEAQEEPKAEEAKAAEAVAEEKIDNAEETVSKEQYDAVVAELEAAKAARQEEAKAAADKLIDDTMAFVSAEESMRILPTERDGLKSLMQKARDEHVVHFAQREEGDSMLDQIVAFAKGLKPITGLFEEMSVSADEETMSGGTLSEEEAIAKAEEAAIKAGTNFSDEFEKLAKLNTISDSQEG